MQSKLLQNSFIIGEKMLMNMEIGTIQKVTMHWKLILHLIVQPHYWPWLFTRFSGYPVQHQGVIEEIWELASDFEQVNLAKVPAHADEIGNEGADRLAKLHIRRNDYWMYDYSSIIELISNKEGIK